MKCPSCGVVLLSDGQCFNLECSNNPDIINSERITVEDGCSLASLNKTDYCKDRLVSAMKSLHGGSPCELSFKDIIDACMDLSELTVIAGTINIIIVKENGINGDKGITGTQHYGDTVSMTLGLQAGMYEWLNMVHSVTIGRTLLEAILKASSKVKSDSVIVLQLTSRSIHGSNKVAIGVSRLTNDMELSVLSMFGRSKLEQLIESVRGESI